LMLRRVWPRWRDALSTSPAGYGRPLAPRPTPSMVAPSDRERGGRADLWSATFLHVIVFNERHLRRVLRSYVAYYQRSCTHLALGKDTPEARAHHPAHTRPGAARAG